MSVLHADPPYLGMCNWYDHDHGDGGRPLRRALLGWGSRHTGC